MTIKAGHQVTSLYIHDIVWFYLVDYQKEL